MTFVDKAIFVLLSVFLLALNCVPTCAFGKTAIYKVEEAKSFGRNRATQALAFPGFTYNGGSVVFWPEVYSSFWGSLWSDSSHQAAAQNLNRFLTDLVNSNFMNILSQYGVANGSGTAYFMGDSFVSNVPSQLTDTQIQGIIQTNINSGVIPEPPANNPSQILVIYLDETIAVNASQIGIVMCEPSGNTAFGYHNYFITAANNPFYYCVIPSLNDTCVIDSCGSSPCSLSLSETQEQRRTQVTSHEFSEAATDPVPGTGWYDSTDLNSGECGDICNGISTTISSNNDPSVNWTIQKIYSRYNDQISSGTVYCVSEASTPIPELSNGPTIPPPPPTPPTPTPTPPTPTPTPPTPTPTPPTPTPTPTPTPPTPTSPPTPTPTPPTPTPTPTPPTPTPTPTPTPPPPTPPPPTSMPVSAPLAVTSPSTPPSPSAVTMAPQQLVVSSLNSPASLYPISNNVTLSILGNGVVSTGLIVGVVVAGAVILIGTVLLIVFLVRRRSRSKAFESWHADYAYTQATTADRNKAENTNVSLQNSVFPNTPVNTSLPTLNPAPESLPEIALKVPPKTPIMQPPKVSIKQPPKAPIKQPPKTPIKQPPKAPIKQPPKMPIKQPPKMPIKQPPKIPIKQPLKMPVKQQPKAPIKQPPKMPIKQQPKAPIKQPPKMPIKQRPKAPIKQPPKMPIKQPPKVPTEKPPRALDK